ncbi:MAG: DUF3256 family protein [Muribaculaceae bacterium]|nr:DUF3256 family protein [Muribaculaceae bacterium]
MKRIIILIMALVPIFFGAKAATKVAEDTITARRAFVELPSEVLELLNSTMRQNMLSWYDNDSIAPIVNAMEGVSSLVPPVTRDYLQVQVTPVSRMTLRILPRKGKLPMVMTVYTLGDSLQAKDSDVRFYDENMTLQPRNKHLKPLSTIDFLDTGDMKREERDKLLDLIPFPMVEYSVGPESTDLKASLTAGEYLGQEDFKKIEPYLRPERILRWNGHKYELLKD